MNPEIRPLIQKNVALVAEVFHGLIMRLSDGIVVYNAYRVYYWDESETSK